MTSFNLNDLHKGHVKLGLSYQSYVLSQKVNYYFSSWNFLLDPNCAHN